jgi:hypothetical protein
VKLRVGDLVEVRSKQEILGTLDRKGQLDGMPFMPEMFAFCGQRFKVFKRAHKTCDTVFPVRGRRVADAVHLETRCNGQSHGGCEASCLIFWKEAWLKRVDSRRDGSVALNAPATQPGADRANQGNSCSEQDVLLGTRTDGTADNGQPTYLCQATQLPYATHPLEWWDLRQYVEDYTSGNVNIRRLAAGFVFVAYRALINLGIGLGAPLRWLYDQFQRIRGGVPYPLRQGMLPAGSPTPATKLNLEAGEWVRVKSYPDILATCDTTLKNRGMFFDKEMVPYCGEKLQVLKRVNRIIDEKSGKMLELKNPCMVLDGAFCRSCYSESRMFCPRAIYSYWREIWLERAE